MSTATKKMRDDGAGVIVECRSLALHSWFGFNPYYPIWFPNPTRNIPDQSLE